MGLMPGPKRQRHPAGDDVNGPAPAPLTLNRDELTPTPLTSYPLRQALISKPCFRNPKP